MSGEFINVINQQSIFPNELHTQKQLLPDQVTREWGHALFLHDLTSTLRMEDGGRKAWGGRSQIPLNLYNLIKGHKMCAAGWASQARMALDACSQTPE